jgi:enoyl-CoA hydratase/carnithine racemase
VSEHLKFTVEDGIATITLNRPEKLNAFTDEMLERWLIVLEECRTDEAVRVIIMTGTGRAFTTGGDVDGFAAARHRPRPASSAASPTVSSGCLGSWRKSTSPSSQP